MTASTLIENRPRKTPARKIGRFVTTRLNRLRDSVLGVRHLIYFAEGPFSPPEDQPELTVKRYTAFDEIPTEIVADIAANSKKDWEERLREEFNTGGILYVGLIHGEVAMLTRLRPAEYYRKWFVPIEPGDFIGYGMETRPKFRGQHLRENFGKMSTYIEPLTITRVWGDIRVDNEASIRAATRYSNARIVGTVKRPRDYKSFLKKPI